MVLRGSEDIPRYGSEVVIHLSSVASSLKLFLEHLEIPPHFFVAIATGHPFSFTFFQVTLPFSSPSSSSPPFLQVVVFLFDCKTSSSSLFPWSLRL